MLTNNTIVLQKFEALKRQVEEFEKEIQLRIRENRVDNDGYLLHQVEEGKYKLVSKEYFTENLMSQVALANQQLGSLVSQKK